MRSLLIPAVLLLPASTLLAQYTAPVDAKSMLAGLQDIKEKQAKTAQSSLARTIGDFSAAAANDGAALDFYIEAVRVTQFVGQPHEDTAFRDWKKKEIRKLKPPAIRTALRYTTLSLQRAAGATDRQIFPDLLEYAEQTQSMLPLIGDQEIAKAAVTGNIFARWYNIGSRMSGLENWEESPANVDGIYEQFLLPYMRKNRDPRILDYWDTKLAQETAQASNAAAAFSTDRFNQTRRPEILWHRAEDEVAIGMRDQGLTEMYNLVKTFPDHPSAGKWIGELQGLLAPAPAAPAPQ